MKQNNSIFVTLFVVITVITLSENPAFAKSPQPHAIGDQACPPGQVVTGVDPEANIICQDDDVGARANQACNVGEVVTGVDASGAVICANDMTGVDGKGNRVLAFGKVFSHNRGKFVGTSNFTTRESAAGEYEITITDPMDCVTQICDFSSGPPDCHLAYPVAAMTVSSDTTFSIVNASVFSDPLIVSGPDCPANGQYKFRVYTIDSSGKVDSNFSFILIGEEYQAQ